MTNANSPAVPTRRDFLKTSALVGGALASELSFPNVSRGAGNSDKLRIGLIGCGGRGTGAASQALKADSNVQLVAMGDAFPDAIERSLSNLTKNVSAEKINVKPELRFSGLDAYKKVLENVDLVVLATPPGFRPVHLRAAVEADRKSVV